MNQPYPSENLVEQIVTYTLKLDDSLVVIEDVPARVNVTTGEQLFDLETIGRVQEMIFEAQ